MYKTSQHSHNSFYSFIPHSSSPSYSAPFYTCNSIARIQNPSAPLIETLVSTTLSVGFYKTFFKFPCLYNFLVAASLAHGAVNQDEGNQCGTCGKNFTGSSDTCTCSK